MMKLTILALMLSTHAVAIRPTSNAGAPGFLGGVERVHKVQLAFLDAVAQPAVNASQPAAAHKIEAGAVPSAHIATSSESTAAMCAAAQKTIFCPAPDTLEEWKEHATCCMGHCGSGGDKCFDGCIKDCMKVPLDCTGLALQNDCSKQCKKLGDCKKCYPAVTVGETSGCQSKCMVEFDEKVKGKKCTLSR